MTSQEILEKAIQKARDKGLIIDYISKKEVVIYSDGNGVIPLEYLIYNKDFAKAIFGEEKVQSIMCATEHFIPRWQYHLQMMVVANDPIKYLGSNI